jgi:hypothetical protein
MKHLLFACAMALSTSLLAIDRYVDPALGSGNGTQYFNTITSAVAAAVDGDRILIVSGNYAEPTLVLNKSLTLLSQNAGGSINFNGNITIAGVPNMKLQILGFKLGVYSFTGNAITNGSATTRAKVSLIECDAAAITLDQNYYEANLMRCVTSGNITIRYGNVVSSKMTSLYVNDEPLTNQNGRILIANDTVTNRINFLHDDYAMNIYNSLLTNLYLWAWNHSAAYTNKILNNEFAASCYLFIPYAGVPGYNFDFSNNLFNGAINFYAGGDPGSTPSWNGSCGNSQWDYATNYECLGYWSSTGSSFPNPGVSGFFKWTYNGVDLPVTPPTGTQPLVFTEVVGETGTTNTGNPNHEYYDIDLTVNDRGRAGGPYSVLNYNPIANPGNGKAFIFDLEIPADLFPGQAIDIKAKGYHKN